MTTCTKRFLIGSGWKMHNTVAASLTLLRRLRDALGDFDAFPLFVLPPFTALSAVGAALGPDNLIRFGAQNMHWRESGPYTGEIAAPMLTELGCRYVELNHQERRACCGETNETANRKVLAALAHGLTPILCLGEERILPEEGLRAFLREQVSELLRDVAPERVADIVFAYEPRWAIGVAEAASPAHVAKVHGLIRETLGGSFGAKAAREACVIYGGSVDRTNAVELALQDGVDGLFIGRSGLDGDVFATIIRDVERALRV
jgi:triosephosphate isomerase